MSSDSGVSVDTVEPVFAPVEQPQPLAYTTEPIAEVTTTPAVETSSANAEPVTKTSTTKKVVSTVLTALGAGALIGI